MFADDDKAGSSPPLCQLRPGSLLGRLYSTFHDISSFVHEVVTLFGPGEDRPLFQTNYVVDDIEPVTPLPASALRSPDVGSGTSSHGEAHPHAAASAPLPRAHRGLYSDELDGLDGGAAKSATGPPRRSGWASRGWHAEWADTL